MKKSIFFFAALLLAACTAFISCNTEIVQPVDDNEFVGTNMYTFTIAATKDDAATKALAPSADGKSIVASWAEGETVTVFNVTKNTALTGTLTPDPATISSGSCTLKGSLEGLIEDNDELKLEFRTSDYSHQDGTLATIAAYCDYAVATVTATVDATTHAVTTTDANFVNQQAIVKFTLKDGDILNTESERLLNPTSLTVKTGTWEETFTLDPGIYDTSVNGPGVVYLAIPDVSSDLSLTAKLGEDGKDATYTFSKPSGVNFVNGTFYRANISMKFDALNSRFTMQATENGTTITVKNNGNLPLYYSTNGADYVAISTGGTSESITVDAGSIVRFYGDDTGVEEPSLCTVVNYNQYFSNISCDKDCYIYGDFMSLLSKNNYAAEQLKAKRALACLFQNNSSILSHGKKLCKLPSTTLTEACYYCMFDGCYGITTAPELPATSLALNCYKQMFKGCKNLTTAPALPAENLASECYYEMFTNCSGLTTAPALPAENLVSSCYQGMFIGCTGLGSAPALSSTSLAYQCYRAMFQGCTGLTAAPDLPATTLAEYCYLGMFTNCTSLSTLPNLSATRLAIHCYQAMFSGCTSITTIPDGYLPITNLEDNCYESMFSRCTNLGSVPSNLLQATTLKKYCYYYMFNECSSLTTPPTLPAETLASDCYSHMFYKCTNLTSAPALPAVTLKDNCYLAMFYGCTSLTTPPTMSAQTLASGCCQSMFQGCTELTTSPVLSAPTLVELCYRSMFQDCTKLNKITCLATDLTAANVSDFALLQWATGVATSGTFIKAATADWSGIARGESGIPTGWTIKDAQ